MGLNYKVANDGQAKIIIQNGTVDPATTQAGELFYRSDEDSLAVSDGSKFNAVRGGSLRVYGETVAETPNGIITQFTVSNPYVPTTAEVYMNGQKQKLGTDYTESSPAAGQVTFTSAPLTGAVIEISYSRLEGSSLPLFNKFDVVVGTPKQTYSGSTTVFDIPFPYTPGAGNLLVYSSGVLMLEGATEDYLETDNDTITFNTARTGGEVIQFIKVGAANDSGTSGWSDLGSTVVLSNTSDQVQIGTGSAATPALAFTGDTNTGIFSGGADQIQFASGGTNIAAVISSGFQVNTGVFKSPNGSAAAPAYTFSGDVDSGIYNLAADQVGFSANGAFVAGIGAYVGGSGIFPVDGSVSAPSYTFNSDTDLGLYRSAADQMSVASGGNAVAIFAPTNVNLFAGATDVLQIVSTGTRHFVDGSAATPSIHWSGDTDTGIFRLTTDQLAFATGGLQRGKFDENGWLVLSHRITIPDESASAPALTFNNDLDTGLYRIGADNLGIALGGSQRWSFAHPTTTFSGSTIGDAAALQLDVSNSGTGNTSVTSSTDVSQAVLGALGSAAAGSYWAGGGPPRADSAYIQNAGGDNFVILNGAQTTYHYSSNASPIWKFVGGSNDERMELSNNQLLTKSSGSNSAPSLANIADTDTGLLWLSGSINFVVDGGQKANLSTSNGWGVIDGTSAAPSYHFLLDSNTGFYRPSGDQIGFVTGGGLRLTLTNVALTPAGAPGINLGDSLNYFNEINYKTLTDRGCIPWCDTGVELGDGTVVSDLDAIMAIQKHPTEMTIHGLPKLDYSTFPKKSYRPATEEGGTDGVEMTMMFGVMIGAFKELVKKVNDLENQLANK